ncbi:MAG: DUF2007 domain-containing protein [Lachnospiraceae bacterium]
MSQANVVKLCFADDQIQAEIMMDILRQNGIKAYKQGIGSAELMDIYAGNSTYGEYIFINENDEKRAKELLSNLLSEVETEDDGSQDGMNNG